MIKEIIDIVSLSWSKETCYPKLREEWNISNPSLGQCAITSLVINDFMGGKIMRCIINGVSHYYNLINDQIVDLTVSQFKGVIPDYKIAEERSRDYLLSEENTKNRYLVLLKNVKQNFINIGTKQYKIMGEDSIEYFSKIPGTFGGNRKLKIYGKLDCISALRWIKKGYYIENRVFFSDEYSAIRAGYRPCSICMPNEYRKWKELQLNK